LLKGAISVLGETKMPEPKMNRRKSREAAFTLLFEWSFHGEDPHVMIENACLCRELLADSFARDLCVKTIEGVENIDKLIEEYSDTWKISRLSKVTLSVLRLSFCELTLMDDIPVGATINEAVELCKQYATEDEAAYVNGILGKFNRDREQSRGEKQ
jgi:N utilization substance protein B